MFVWLVLSCQPLYAITISSLEQTVLVKMGMKPFHLMSIFDFFFQDRLVCVYTYKLHVLSGHSLYVVRI